MMIHSPDRMLAAIGLGILCLSTMVSAAEDEQSQPSTMVVLELFTSQGCSSCPPADELLAQISKLNDEHKLPVVCLSFHVDYWNSLGWKDPYSKAEFTERQRDYARVFRNRSVYTPQLIVNGKTEFVGSKASAAREAIRDALKEKSRVQIEIKTVWEEEKNQCAIEFSLQGVSPKQLLNIAIVQKQGTNKVPRGENAGRALAHANIVRNFESIAVENPTGKVAIKLPEDLKPQDVRVVVYVQNSESKAISGAIATDVPSK